MCSLLSALTAGIGKEAAGKATAVELSTSGVLSPGAQQFLNGRSYSTSKPKAYLNWILFDEQFNYVQSSSGADPVEGEQEFKVHQFSDLPVNKNGYLYIYVSNETPNIDVFFDNLQVTHIRGPLLEETHYYPFGLTQHGISSQAIGFGQPENKKKFVGQEFDDDLGWNTYQFKFRTHDPQIGRFLQVDPLADKYVHNSTYAYAENRVVNGIDLEGLEFWGTIFRIAPLMENNSVVNRGPIMENVVENGTKASTETATKTSKGLPQETLENMRRGKATEGEQLKKNGLEPNNKPIETIDPRTGKSGTTVPDAFDNGGKSTVEVKEVKNQGLTKQLRLQEKFSNDNGFNPQLIINSGAKISKPLLNSSFEIRTYTMPAVDQTSVKRTIIPGNFTPIPRAKDMQPMYIHAPML